MQLKFIIFELGSITQTKCQNSKDSDRIVLQIRLNLRIVTKWSVFRNLQPSYTSCVTAFTRCDFYHVLHVLNRLGPILIYLIFLYAIYTHFVALKLIAQFDEG